MTASPPRSGPDVRLLAGAGMALLGLMVILLLAWADSLWLGLATTALILAAPVIRARAGLRLAHATDVEEDVDPVLHRLVRGMCDRREPVPVPRIMSTETDAAAAFAGGWPSRPHLVLSRGLQARLDTQEQQAAIARELSRLRQPFAVIDAFAWALPPLALLVLVARIHHGLGSVSLAFLGLAIALSAAAILVHVREVAADDGAVRITEQPRAVADALRTMDAMPPRGTPWALLAGLLFVPPTNRTVRDFTHPSAADRAARLDRRVAQTSTEELTGTIVDRQTTPMTSNDHTARMVLLGVLALGAAVIVLAITALGGGGSGDGTAGARHGGATTPVGTRQGTATTNDSGVCPSAYNGEPDRPAILDAGVVPEGIELRWWVVWCDDTDKGTTFITLHLSGRDGHRLIRHEVPSATRPTRTQYRVVPADLGIAPGRYRWRLVVRDINTNKAERRSAGTIFVPGIP